MLGTAAIDTLTGTNSDDRIAGLAGNDTLNGGAGNDILVGGAGSDLLRGSVGNDVYRFSRGDGADTITDEYRYTESYQESYQRLYSGAYEQWEITRLFTGWHEDGSWHSALAAPLTLAYTTVAYYDSENTPYLWYAYVNDTRTATREVEGDGGADVLEFGSGITAADLMIVTSGADLIVGVKDPSNPNATFSELADKITLTEWVDAKNRIETFRFADGTSISVGAVAWSSGTNAADTLSGTNGNDWMVGEAGNDTLTGGAGSDILVGGQGSDTYRSDRGSGSDLISNAASDAATTDDQLVFGSTVARDQLWFSRSGNNLEVTIVGTNDRAIIENWYGESAERIDKIVAGDGYQLLQGDVQNLVEAMAAFTPPPSGQLTLSSAQHSALDTVIAASWQN